MSISMTTTQSIEDLIPMIYSDIESKRNLISYLKKEYSNQSNRNDSITIKAFTFFDLIDEFDITVSQSLQAIKTLQTEIWNLKETIDRSAEEIKKHYQSNNQREGSPLEKKLAFDYSKIKEYSELIQKSNEETKQSFSLKPLSKEDEENNEEGDEEVLHHIKHQSVSKKDDINIDMDNLDDSNEEEVKIPLRKSIRQIIKCPSGASYRNQLNKKQFPFKLIGHNMNDNYHRIKELLDKISLVDTYRIYLADKYGNGSYEQFTQLLRDKKIDDSSLEEELKIISEIMTKQLTTTPDLPTNNNVTITSRQSNRTEGAQFNSRNSKRIAKPQKAQHSYIEPVKFASYLRTDNNKLNKAKYMSFSQEKTYK